MSVIKTEEATSLPAATSEDVQEVVALFKKAADDAGWDYHESLEQSDGYSLVGCVQEGQPIGWHVNIRETKTELFSFMILLPKDMFEQFKEVCFLANKQCLHYGRLRISDDPYNEGKCGIFSSYAIPTVAVASTTSDKLRLVRFLLEDAMANIARIALVVCAMMSGGLSASAAFEKEY